MTAKETQLHNGLLDIQKWAAKIRKVQPDNDSYMRGYQEAAMLAGLSAQLTTGVDSDHQNYPQTDLVGEMVAEVSNALTPVSLAVEDLLDAPNLDSEQREMLQDAKTGIVRIATRLHKIRPLFGISCVQDDE